MNVYQKLNEAREKFHTSPIKKSGLNKFAGYKYFELGDFVVPAIQIFKEVGLTSVIRFGSDQAVMEIVKIRLDGYYENLVYLKYIIVENGAVRGTYYGGEIDVIMFCHWWQ